MKKTPVRPTFHYLLIAAIALPVFVRIIALLYPVERAWGFDLLLGLAPWEQVMYSLLPLLALLLLSGRIGRGAVKLEHTHGHLIAAAGLLLLLAATLLWPMETFFHGDGGLLIPQIHRFSIGEQYDAALLLNLKSSPLTGVLLTAAMHAVPFIASTFGLDYPATALYPFRVVSAIALLGAALYIMIALPRRERLAAMLLLGGTAGVLLAFGYVEYYAPVFAAILVFLLAGKKAIEERTSVMPAVLVWIVAVAAHYLALALLPAVVYLLALRYPASGVARSIAQHPFRWALALFSAFLALYVAFALTAGDSRIFMPVREVVTSAGTQHYTLFSAWHLVDVLNLLLLLAPAALLMLGGRVFLKKTAPEFEHTPTLRFALLASLFLAAFVFFANTSLGLARDWDLTAPLGVGLLFAAMVMLNKHRSAVLALGLASVLLTLPWLLVNLRADTAAGRFEKVMHLDERIMFGDYAISGYEALRKHYWSRGDTGHEIELIRSMITLLDYPQHYRELLDAAVLLHGNDPQQYDSLQQWMLWRLTARGFSLTERGASRDYGIGLDQIDSLAQGIGVQALGLRVPYPALGLSAVADVTRAGRAWPAIEGMQAYARGDFEAAVAGFEEAVAAGFASPLVYLFSGNSLAITGRHAAALERLDRGVALFPNDAMLRYTLGKYYVRAGVRSDRAYELLAWCLEHGSPKERLPEISQLLQGLAASQQQP